jgi:putative transposase
MYPEKTDTFTARTIKEAWQALDKSGGDTRVLIPAFDLRGAPGSIYINAKVEELLKARIASEQDKKSRLRPLDLIEFHRNDVDAWNSTPGTQKIEPASDRTVRRRFQSNFDAYDITCRNRGEKVAKRLFRNSGARIRADEPLLATQFDDTDGEVFLIDELSGLPWGRAFLTLGIDENTASILGKEISEKHRDTWSAISALVNSILPANMSDPEYADCENSWYAYGKQGTVQFDNATYNRAPQFFDGAIADAQALPGWSKPKTPTGKTQIENLNNLIKTDFTPNLPGWRGPKRERDGLAEGPGTAVMTLQEYRRMFNKWACDRYSNRPRELGLTPRQMWNQHFKDREPRMPLDTQGFRLIATLRSSYKLRASGGLMRMGLRYNSDALEKLRDRIGHIASVAVRVHPYDLSKVYVFNPDLKVFITVPSIEHHDYLRGLTNHQQALILKKCRDNGKKNPSLKDCTQAKVQLCVMAEQLRRSKKMRDRKAAYRNSPAETAKPQASGEPNPTDAPSPKCDTTKKPSAQVSVTHWVSELEERMIALSEVDLSDNSEEYQDDGALAGGFSRLRSGQWHPVLQLDRQACRRALA